MKSINQRVIYQIYPKSFCDANNDGIGDIKGIISKLPYLNELGVDMLWLCPIYLSPQVDNGYDVSDYYKIDPIYGSMQDLELLIKEAKILGIDIMLDMVFNHTSIEHEWFKAALKGDKKYLDYYIFKEYPTNWQSKFGGSAWEYVDDLKLYYLHLFDKTQADLNWKNSDVRDELIKVLKFWLEKGVTGFRFDVINLIDKPDEFISDETDGRHFYTDGKRVVEYLQMLNDQILNKYDTLTVGEMSSTSIENCIKYSNKDMNTLDMTFSFVHLKLDYVDNYKWGNKEIDLYELKKLLSTWQVKMNENGGVNALFWSNHDQPRIVNRLGDYKKYHYESATAIGSIMMLLKGVPFIYQGDELGHLNAGFDNIDQYRDVESINFFNNSNLEVDEKLSILNIKSRDNGRTPIFFDELSSSWIEHSKLKYSQEIKDNIFSFYKKLINLKKGNIIIQEGDYQLIDTNDSIYHFTRTLNNETINVVVNLSGDMLNINQENTNIILNNYDNYTKNILNPYQVIVY